nr:hypothetical protein [Tanacetum cinerariifolium]
DSHVTLTPVNPDGQQQSSSVSSQFVTNMLNPTLDVVSAIPGIVQQYMDQRMNEAVKVAVQIQSDRLHDEAQRENDEFLKTTSYVAAADLSEMELKKILIEKMEGNKSIKRSDAQRNLYKALDEEPSTGPDRGSKRRKEGKEPESASAPTEIATRSAGRDDEMMMLIRMKNPLLDQTGGQRDAKKERSPSQQALQRKLLPGALAGLHKVPDLDRRRQASLL